VSQLAPDRVDVIASGTDTALSLAGVEHSAAEAGHNVAQAGRPTRSLSV